MFSFSSQYLIGTVPDTLPYWLATLPLRYTLGQKQQRWNFASRYQERKLSRRSRASAARASAGCPVNPRISATSTTSGFRPWLSNPSLEFSSSARRPRIKTIVRDLPPFQVLTRLIKSDNLLLLIKTDNSQANNTDYVDRLTPFPANDTIPTEKVEKVVVSAADNSRLGVSRRTLADD
jgi:hypothetical protein